MRLLKISVYNLLVLSLAGILSACSTIKTTDTELLKVSTDSIEFIILQMNDIYEITPVSGGRQGGLARVAALRKELLAENPNTITVLAGDLFSPSALGTAKVEGQLLAGKQIVAVMNTLGLDYITFGNHEFDIKEQSFLDRLAESRFTWISSNVYDRNHQPFPGVLDSKIIDLHDRLGKTVRIGIFGLTIPSNKKEYVSYADPLEVGQTVTAELRGQVDILIGLTHLALEGDIALAGMAKGIDLILGGHEHENYQLWRGPDMTPVFKADSNARTVYIHRISFNTATKEISITSELREINAAITPDPKTEEEVERWIKSGFAAFRQSGFAPEQVVAQIPETLDGLEASVRTRQTNLTRLIAESILKAVPDAELAIFNSGSVRIDDLLPPGPLTQYDILRILPFNGRVCEATLEGKLLWQVLDQGEANRGNGGFLQMAGVTRDEQNHWLINGSPLDPKRAYRVATNDFLLSGREQNLGFFSSKNPKLKANCTDDRDIRFLFKDFLAATYGGN